VFISSPQLETTRLLGLGLCLWRSWTRPALTAVAGRLEPFLRLCSPSAYCKSLPNFRVKCLPPVMLKNCHYNGCTACVSAFQRVRYEQFVSYHVLWLSSRHSAAHEMLLFLCYRERFFTNLAFSILVASSLFVEWKKLKPTANELLYVLSREFCCMSIFSDANDSWNSTDDDRFYTYVLRKLFHWIYLHCDCNTSLACRWTEPRSKGIQGSGFAQIRWERSEVVATSE